LEFVFSFWCLLRWAALLNFSSDLMVFSLILV
jgi:hypothetical protein